MRLTRLDALRGLAATSVVIFHYPSLLIPPGAPLVLTGLPFLAVLEPFYTNGNYAVPFFWLLSGIVFYHNYAAQNVTLGSYFWRRVARLYPLHLVTLLAMAALNLAFVRLVGFPAGPANDLPHFVLQLAMATNWFVDFGHSFNYPIWSVSMELIAYASFFLFLRFTSRGLLPLAAILAGALTLALGFANYLATAVALFFIGCVVARIGPRAPRSFAVAALIGGAGFVLAVALSPWSRHVALATEYALFPAILLAILKIDLSRPPLRREWIGNLSFGIYLMHIPLITVLRLLIALTGVNPAREGWFLVVTMLLVLGAAALSYRYLERPAQDAILRWRGLKPPRSEASADPYIEIDQPERPASA